MTFLTDFLNVEIPEEKVVVEILDIYGHRYFIVNFLDEFMFVDKGTNIYEYLNSYKTIKEYVKKAKLKNPENLCYLWVDWESIQDLLESYIPGYDSNDMIETHVEDFIPTLTQAQQDNIKKELLSHKRVKMRSFEEMQNTNC